MSSEDIPVRSSAEESAELFAGKESTVSFDTTDPINAGLGFSPEKYAPRGPVSKLDIESINSRAAPIRRK
jgi:hypothetical protein